MIDGEDYKIENGHLTIFDGVTEIERDAFSEKKITNIEIPPSVTSIGDYAFLANNLTNVEILDSVTSIGVGAFSANNLTNVEIPPSVTSIEDYAFSDNDLTSIKISNSVTAIGKFAFFTNNLTNIEIPDSVTSIGVGAFSANNLTKVKIPPSVINIEASAFDNINIIYDEVLINKNMLKKYGCQNIIKIYELQKIIPLDQVYNIPAPILEIIPSTKDAIKGYILNRKIFENLNTFAESEDEYKDFFKMCFALGLFTKPSEEVITFIKQIKKEKTKDYIHQMWTAVKLTTFKPKFKDLFIKLYNEGETEYNGQNIIGRLYSSFEKISKYTLKRHEDIMGKKNTEIKRLKELGANTIYLEQELEVLKKNKKNISYEDICYYIKNNVFDIREGNEELKSVVDTLTVHIEQDGFDKIQDMYEESKGVIKTIPLTMDTGKHEFRYHWSKSDNPVNTILGYIVGCCAKLGGAGKDIMRQSMINPDVANLIIYDENNNIIGKATAYYNRKKKYILFNNAETKVITSKGLKSEKQRQKECLEALIRGAMDAVNALKEKGQDIKEVRIGMLRNDLEDAITEYGLKISYNLLDSYNWQGYSGDASDTAKGQAILYKDDEFDKNKNI